MRLKTDVLKSILAGTRDLIQQAEALGMHSVVETLRRAEAEALRLSEEHERGSSTRDGENGMGSRH